MGPIKAVEDAVEVTEALPNRYHVFWSGSSKKTERIG